MQQTTLKDTIEVDGYGVHSGAHCTVILRPAEADYGIKFVRTDLKQSVEIPVCTSVISQETLMRQTVLRAPADSNVEVRTIEHILSTFHGMGISNVSVEMSASEAPIWDGSAKLIAEAVAKVGIRSIEGSTQRFLSVDRPLAFSASGNGLVEYAAWPSEYLTVSYFLQYDHPVIGTQAVTFRVDHETFRNQIAPSRTFCTSEEIDYLRSKGLIRGGDLDSAVIVGPEGVLNTELLWKDELARHKLLDLVGDLMLCGTPMRGHFLSFRGGHQGNAEFVRFLEKELQNQDD